MAIAASQAVNRETDGKEVPPEAGQTAPAETITKTDFGFVLALAGRTYEVRGLNRRDNKLKATVKGIKGEGSGKRIYPDTVDFYSARSRAGLVKGMCDLFGEDQEIITADVQRLLELSEKHQQPDKNKPE